MPRAVRTVPPKGVPMGRVGDCHIPSPAREVARMRRAGVALGVALGLALSVPALASGATIKVTETDESATFTPGGPTPANYFAQINPDISNHNHKCSLREAIEAANTHAEVDGC